MISEAEFKALGAQGFNRVALVASAFADLETPLSLYFKLARRADQAEPAPLSFLLESVVGGERFGRYSFIGLPANTFLRASGFGAQAKTNPRSNNIAFSSAIKFTSNNCTESAPLHTT